MWLLSSESTYKSFRDMQNSKSKHICNFVMLKNRYHSGLIVSFKGLSLFFALYNVYLFSLIRIKKSKKAEVYKCSICGKYEWKCPNCNLVEVMDNVPRLYHCKECGKISYFDPYLNSFGYLFQHGRKP